MGRPAKGAPEMPAPEQPADPLASLREDPSGPRYPAADAPADTGADHEPDAPGDADPLLAIIGEAVGAASTCWVGGTGDAVFDTERAGSIVEGLVAALRPLTAPAADPDAAVAVWHNDTVALGFLHKGGRCGCGYLATMILGG